MIEFILAVRLSYADIIGTTKTAQDCSQQALVYLQNKRKINPDFKFTYGKHYEWLEFSGECSAVYYEDI